jgi:hypothetical protein
MILSRTGPASAREIEDKAPVGLPVSDFSSPDFYGNQVGVVASQRSLLVFVSSTCALCSELLPAIIALAASPPQPTQVIAVSCNQRSDADEKYIRRFLRAKLPFVHAPELCYRLRADRAIF